MYQQKDDPEINFDQLLNRIRGFFGRVPSAGRNGGGSSKSKWPYLVLAVLVIAVVGWLASGLYTVNPGEQAALRLVGKFQNLNGPGLHWFWPSPIGKVDVVSVDQVQTLELGFRGDIPIIEESSMITGDENIVEVGLVVQYDIKDLESYLFRAVDPDGETLKDAAETALRQVVGSKPIDSTLIDAREEVQAETKVLLQGLLDLYETGINVREVKLQNVRPPAEVQDAFDDVVRARENREQIINLAEAYQEDIIPRARGEASKMKQAAEAYSRERTEKAEGQAGRFLSVLNEYKKSPEVTKQRLYLEAMEEILPGITKFIVDSENSGNLLQFLPLTKDNTISGTVGTDQ
jgi:membrane protease subunit HflK